MRDPGPRPSGTTLGSVGPAAGCPRIRLRVIFDAAARFPGHDGVTRCRSTGRSPGGRDRSHARKRKRGGAGCATEGSWRLRRTGRTTSSDSATTGARSLSTRRARCWPASTPGASRGRTRACRPSADGGRRPASANSPAASLRRSRPRPSTDLRRGPGPEGPRSPGCRRSRGRPSGRPPAARPGSRKPCLAATVIWRNSTPRPTADARAWGLCYPMRLEPARAIERSRCALLPASIPQPDWRPSWTPDTPPTPPRPPRPSGSLRPRARWPESTDA